MDTLDKVDIFLKTYNLPDWIKRKHNLNRPVTGSGLEFVTKKKKLPAQEHLGLDGFTEEFWQTYKEGLILIIPKLFKKKNNLKMTAHSKYHSTSLVLPWYQNQTNTLQKKKITGQYLWWI